MVQYEYRFVRNFCWAKPDRSYSTATNKKLYSDTILLPKTSFSLRPLPLDKDQIKEKNEGLWRWQASRSSRPVWSMLDGPPYANGSLHMGHALNKILKDIINRYKLLLGFRINYKPGFDCHGLPLEIKAIESLKICEPDLLDYSPVTIRNEARKTAEEGVKLQTEEFKRLSILADWDNAWRTMDHKFEIKQLELFEEMLKDELIYRQRKPVFFSPSSRTVLAESEIEYREDHVSRSVYVLFDVVHQSFVLKRTMECLAPDLPIKAIIWTTTPWTLPANQALVVNKNAKYSLVKVAGQDPRFDEIYIFATERLQILKDILVSKDFEIIAELTGEEIASSRYQNDFSKEDLPIFTADHVTLDSGSGIVHTAPSHGHEDFVAYKLYRDQTSLKNKQQQPEFIDIVDDLGRFKFHGAEDWKQRLNEKSVLQEGNSEVILMLKEHGRLVGKEIKIRHKYPHDWRTKKPVITKITDQWFLDLRKIRSKVFSATDKIKFIPESSRIRFESFLNSRSEWCISRQRPWGVPIPLLYSLENGKPLATPSAVNWILEILKSKGVDYWWKGPVAEFIPSGVTGRYRKGEDTMDVWFDSGVSWTTLDGVSADVVVEGSDQHRGWFQSLLLTYSATKHDPGKDLAYHCAVTHGFVLDKYSRKMSKSLGNIISPIEIIEGNSAKKQAKFGLDVLRFWTASVDFTKDVSVGIDQLSRLSETVRKIRSTARFLLGNVYNEINQTYKIDASPIELGILERYMLHLLYEFQAAIKSAYHELNFKQVVQLVTKFTTNTLSAFYFEASKDILYNDSKNSLERQRLLFVMMKILDVYQFALAPILPQLSEEIFAHRRPSCNEITVSTGSNSIFEECWPNVNGDWKDDIIFEKMQPLLSVKSKILHELEILRQEKKVRSSEEVELVVDLSSCDNSLNLGAAILLENGNVLPRLFGLSDVSVCKTETVTQTVIGLASPAWFHAFQWEPIENGPMKMFILPAWRSECPRCWKFTREDGCETCDRCSNVLSELSDSKKN
ncbi:isoleucyl-tRNA synthetase [Phakopsora pachyrhizi]|uniref:isoleucine--tRNA ligase n=1 Tax=Phakopsora pachyrhizi TaxID=170000 RepID=A0AAV0BR11_PHAPC|nr:isoleucyl-tRNA synthetase [Phakopsora pachyrhizi]